MEVTVPLPTVQVIVWVSVTIGLDNPMMVPVAAELPLQPAGKVPSSGPLTVRLVPSDTTVTVPVEAGKGVAWVLPGTVMVDPPTLQVDALEVAWSVKLLADTVTL